MKLTPIQLPHVDGGGILACSAWELYTIDLYTNIASMKVVNEFIDLAIWQAIWGYLK